MTSLARKLSISDIGEDEVGKELNQGSGGQELSAPTLSNEFDNVRRVNVNLANCLTSRVVVFGDRAQVERIVEVETDLKGKKKEKKKKEEEEEEREEEGREEGREEEGEGRGEEKKGDKGPLLVVISDVPQGCDNSSIRVSQLSGSATILEVAIENINKEILRDEDPKKEAEKEAGKEDEKDEEGKLLNPEEKKDKEKKEKVELTRRKKKTLHELGQKEAELNEEKARLEKERVWIEAYAAQQYAPTSGVKLSIEQAKTFLSFYDESGIRIDNRVDEIDEELAQLAEKRKTLVEVRSVKSVYLLLDDAEGALAFSLSYVMFNAGWKPTYDIRVQSDNSSTVELTYHGVITNSTGENWKDAELALSTAQPQIGGNPPALKTLTAHFPYAKESRRFRSADAGGMLFKSKRKADVQVAEAKESATSTTFRIPRKATINSDSQPHKVTVEIANLSGAFSHIIIPKLSKHAYLRSKSTNTTNFPFLAGKANVFMDDTFVATSELKTTNPGEEIVLYLGSDPTVVVEFKESFFKSVKGMVHKSAETRYQHDITIKNTKGMPINCDLFDQLPKSQEDKIKVTVIRPQIEDKEREGGCVLVPQNHSVRWKLKIQPGKQVDTVFEYQIEHSANKNIDFVV